MSDEELLYQVGAIIRTEDAKYGFTNAGMLFFASQPQRRLAYAYVRLLQFNAARTDLDRGLPTFQKEFKGPLSKQLRETQVFFRESGFFKTY